MKQIAVTLLVVAIGEGIIGTSQAVELRQSQEREAPWKAINDTLKSRFNTLNTAYISEDSSFNKMAKIASDCRDVVNEEVKVINEQTAYIRKAYK